MYINNKNHIKKNKGSNIVTKFETFKNNKNFKFLRKKKLYISILNLRGKQTRMGYVKNYKFFKKYNKYANAFMYPIDTIGRIMRKFFRKKFYNRKHKFVIEKYNNIFPFFKKSTILERIAVFLKSKKKKFKFKFKFKSRSFNNNYKKSVFFLKNKLKFSIKDFYKYYILRLFSDFNFKFFFFKILKKLNQSFDTLYKFSFLKYEFFGHSYFKRKLFFIFKFKLTNYFLYKIHLKKIKIKKKDKFLFKINILNKIKYNISVIKCWLLYFFLSKYQFYNLTNINLNLVRLLCLDLKRIFFLHFSIFDKNFKSFISYNKKFINWLYYNTNRKIQKMKSIFGIFGFEEDFSSVPVPYNRKGLLSIYNSKILLSIYNSIVFLQMNIKLNNVFMTISNIEGKVLFKYSTGFYGIKGRKKRDPGTLYKITNNIAKKLKKFERLNIILKIKRKFRNKYYRQILNSLKKNQIVPICYFFIVNRDISKRRLKKARRL